LSPSFCLILWELRSPFIANGRAFIAVHASRIASLFQQEKPTKAQDLVSNHAASELNV
jgi:hypothetical protein